MSTEQNLKWLSDSPMFIDERQVDRFYDAIAKPQYIEESYSSKFTKEQTTKISTKLKVELKSDLLSTIFPFIPTVAAEAAAEAEGKKTDQGTQNLKVIHNSERNLGKLTFHYLTEETDRILFINELKEIGLINDKTIQQSPKLLTFLDLPPEMPIIPIAAEFENGKIELLYKSLNKENGENPPVYPEKEKDGVSLQDLRKEYWSWFSSNYSATKSMISVEEAASTNGKIRWIAYRIPLDKEGSTLHLHVSARENYDTGTLAYNFIKRGFKHGLRLVGTLKSEPDMNVLAIYEK